MCGYDNLSASPSSSWSPFESSSGGLRRPGLARRYRVQTRRLRRKDTLVPGSESYGRLRTRCLSGWDVSAVNSQTFELCACVAHGEARRRTHAVHIRALLLMQGTRIDPMYLAIDMRIPFKPRTGSSGNLLASDLSERVSGIPLHE